MSGGTATVVQYELKTYCRKPLKTIGLDQNLD